MAKRVNDPLLDGLTAGLKLPPAYTVSQWADAKRILPAYSSMPGRWRTSIAPYQAEPMDVMNDPSVEFMVMKWSSQPGKTEVILNGIGYHIEHKPAAMMLVLPTEKLVKGFSTKRLQAMLTATPSLRKLVAEEKGRDASNTQTSKDFPGGFLLLNGANSPTNLASWPIQILFLDEIDKFEQAVGNDGDPIKQAIQRTITFKGRRKIVLSSTPSLEGMSHIDRWYNQSDQREFHVPCPECDEEQFMDFFPDEQTGVGGVRWPEGEPEKAEYCCKHCGSLWNQKQLIMAVKAGRWISQRPGEKIVGFHINALYAPWETMADLADEWESSKDKEEEKQTFINLKLGLSFKMSEKVKATASQLMARADDFSAQKIPIQVMLITAGVDVQRDRLECQIVGFGTGEERFVISNTVLPGNPQTRDPWDKLDALLSRSYPHPGNGTPLYVEACAVDTGYEIDLVMKYCHEHQARGNPVYAVKGASTFDAPAWRQSTQQFKAGKKLYIVGSQQPKLTIYSSLVNNEPGEGHINFSHSLNEDYYKQLLAEQLVKKPYRGRLVVMVENTKNRRNEALDTLVYATAARWSLGHIDYIERFRRLVTDEPAHTEELVA